MDSQKFEKTADSAYRKFAPIAKKYYFTLRRPSVTRRGAPCMIFLGNHSSGKSTLINWVLGDEPIQETGLAPTDDGFTIIIYGDVEEDICGPAALARLPAEFSSLENFGESFLHHLKVKVRNRKLLKTVSLIDTPGMIDSAESTLSRTYDFEGVIRVLADLCDMVFFLFDPDKPGTTGETVSVFSRCLAGIEFKLRVLLNKCDAFSGLYDFARTYGTVCWNIARVLRTKDLPKIWTVYSGSEKASVDFDLSDFNKHREEFKAILADASSRRKDNVYSQAMGDFTALAMRMRIVNHVARQITFFRATFATVSVLFTLALSLLVWYVLMTGYDTGKIIAYACAGTTAAISLTIAHFIAKYVVRIMRRAFARKTDEIFEKEYRREFATGTHDNMRQVWTMIRNETSEIIKSAPLHLPIFGESKRRKLERATRKVLEAHKRND